MSTLSSVYTGALAPESLSVSCRQGDSIVDMTTVTGGELHVRKPDGTKQVWPAFVSLGPEPPAPTPELLTLVHPFDAGDVDEAGCYTIIAHLTLLGGGYVRTQPKVLHVFDEFSINCTT